METVKSYLENMFLSLPKTEEIERIKNDMLANMEEKYLELKKEGKQENEAIGIVISEFGNIEELLEEMNIKTDTDRDAKQRKIYPRLSLEKAKEYITLKRETSRWIALGVGLILFGVASMLFLVQCLENDQVVQSLSESARDVAPVMALFLFVVPAVALFVYNGMTLEPYKYIEEGEFELTTEDKAILVKEHKGLSMNYKGYIMLGVCLCVVSPVSIFIAMMFGEDLAVYGVSVLLIIIAVAVNLLIRAGSAIEGYKRLLKLEEYSVNVKENNKMIGIVAGIVWPLAAATFLFLGFVFNLWHISWIIFPITGILFGGFSAAYSNAKAK